MNFETEIKYLKMTNTMIKFVDSKKVNFRCLICGDSKKNKWKARAYLLPTDDGNVIYTCHNCSTTTRFIKALAQASPTLADSYKREKVKDKITNFIKDSNPFNKTKETSEEIVDIDTAIVINETPYLISDLNNEAIKYLENRKMRKEDYKSFKYVSDLNAILIPFFNKKKECIGYQLRFLEYKRFHNHIPKKNPKIYGLDRINNIIDNKVYVFESIFCMYSSGIDNSIAMIGSSLSDEVIEKYLKGYHLIFCFDNDETGFKKAIKYSKEGYNVLVHQKDYPLKDFNEAEMVGVKREQIKKYILDNILSPKMANFKLRLS